MTLIALFFSLEPRETMEKLLTEHKTDPSRRTLQRHVAREMTTLLHGREASESTAQGSYTLQAWAGAS